MRTVAVLPIKTFASAKQRLADAIGGAERKELAGAMVEDVLGALAAVTGLEAVIVVSAEPAAARLAEAAGAVVVRDPEETGQSAAADLGVETAIARGAERVLLVPGDCPALDARELGPLLERRQPVDQGPQVVIVPDRHGQGTNALLLTPPAAIVPSFGPGSFARHAARARAAGAEVKIAQVPSLALDIDTSGDLAVLRETLAARPEGAARTREVLRRLVLAAAPAAG